MDEGTQKVPYILTDATWIQQFHKLYPTLIMSSEEKQPSFPFCSS